MITRNHYIEQIKGFYDSDLIKIIVGIRRSGKSIILEQIMNDIKNKTDNIIYLNFEDEAITTNIYNAETLIKYVNDNRKEGKCYIFLDEIQLIDNWNNAVKSLRLHNNSVFITGSNSKLLSKDLTTFLTGRYISIELYPFSFSEFCKYKEELNEKCIFKNELNSPLENLFDEYLNYGGFPLAIMAKDYKTIVLNDLFSSIVLNDVVKRYEIRNVGLFFRITKYLMENVGNLISVNSIYNYLKHEDLKLTKNTVYNYLSYLEDAYFLLNENKEDLFGK